MRVLTTAAIAVAFAAAAAPASAQEALFEIEGEIRQITPHLSGGGATMEVMGVDIEVPHGTPISTPTRTDLAVSDLVDGSSFPGRREAGFLGGTAKVLGTFNGDKVDAIDVFVEPAENLVLGRVTRNGTDENGKHHFEIEGMAVVLTAGETGDSYPPSERDAYDWRIPGLPIMNEYGFEVDPETLAAGTVAVAEGYMGLEPGETGSIPVLYSFLIESTGGELKNKGIAEVSVLRAQCRFRTDRDRLELDVLGAAHDHAGSTSVSVFDANNLAREFGSANLVADAENPEFSQYGFDFEESETPLAIGGCPTEVKVSLSGDNSGAYAIGSVDIRTD